MAKERWDNFNTNETLQTIRTKEKLRKIPENDPTNCPANALHDGQSNLLKTKAGCPREVSYAHPGDSFSRHMMELRHW